jgi:hypothetical protein
MNPTTIRLSMLRTFLHRVRAGHVPEYHEVYVHGEDTRVVCSLCAHAPARATHPDTPMRTPVASNA